MLDDSILKTCPSHQNRLCCISIMLELVSTLEDFIWGGLFFWVLLTEAGW